VNELKSNRRRATVVMLAVMAILCTFVVKLVDIQVVNANELNAQAQSIAARRVSTTLHGMRGRIVDSEGVVLADSVTQYDVTLSPKKTVDYLDAAQQPVTVAKATADIGAILGKTGEQIRAIVSSALADNPTSDFAYVARGVSVERFRALDALNVPWLFMKAVEGRIYPNGSVAGNLLGFVGTDNIALAGIERSADECLAGSDGAARHERGADNVEIPGTSDTIRPSADGGSVVLTIDNDLQWFAQQRLAEQVKAVGATNGIVTVLEVKTGKLRAVAETPAVDPNNVGVTPAQWRGSAAFSAPFEPGSTFKTITAAALLDSGQANPLSQVVAPYEYTAPNGANFHDSDPHEPENLTLTGALVNSSNTGISQLGARLSDQERHRYLQKFGVGTATAVDFPAEAPGMLHPYEDWDNQTAYTTMFGQGLSASAIQVAAVYQTLGNGGVRMPVQLVEGCKQADGTMTQVPSNQGIPVVSAAAATGTVNMLENVATKGWLKKTLEIPGYRIGVKTGTAQQADSNGGYSKSYLVSLSGLAPADDPQFVVSVNIANPVTMTTSAASAPVFRDVMSQALKKYRVQPSNGQSSDIPTSW